MDKENIEDVYPMSDIQVGMFFHSLKEPDRAVYHGQLISLHKDGSFDPGILKKAVALMVEKHPILRTGFNIDGFKEPVQIVFKTIVMDIEHVDISYMNETQQQRYIKSLLVEDKKLSFDLKHPVPLWRMRTFALDKETICFVWIRHHAVADGWSTAALMMELSDTYIKLKSDANYAPKKLKNTYKQYVLEERVARKRKEAREYWRNELAGYKRMNFPEMAGIESKSPGQRTYVKDLGSELREKLNRVAGKYNISFKSLCFAAYIYMLNMLSYDEDVTAGLVTHNRPVCEDGEKIIGCFLNTVPVRIQIPPSLKWWNYIEWVNRKLKELADYSRMSLLEIVNCIGEESGDYNPIFDTLFNFVDFHIYNQINPEYVRGSSKDKDEKKLSLGGIEVTNTIFDCSVLTTLGNFMLNFNYKNTLFSQRLIENLAGYFERVLDKFIHDREGIISKEELLSGEERERLIYEFNKTRREYPKDRLIHELFEEQAAKTPDGAAVVGKRENVGEIVQITYGELNKRSDQLAHVLREKGVVPGTIAGIMVERSLEMIIGIFGILKAGGAYLPIEPEYPQERIDYMLKDSNARILLSKVSGGIGVVKPGELSAGLPTHSTQLCYVIYTSGTTARPRGVLVGHGNVVNTLVYRRDEYKMDSGVTTLQLFSYAFDGFVTDFFTPVIAGARIILLSEKERKDINRVKAAIVNHKVTHLLSTPALYRAIIESLSPAEAVSLKVVTLAGDRVFPDLLEATKRKNAAVEVAHEYGVTEAAVMSTIFRHQERAGGIKIGHPIGNTCIYIVDERQRLQPIGAAGEICIGGVGVSRGYLNKPELTAEKYFYRSYRSYRLHFSKKIYKTGDLGRWLPEGDIEFLGRVDHQVKIRGFRIEPGEIECRLLEHDEITRAVVIPMETPKGSGSGAGENDRYLCAYIAAKNLQPPSVSELRAHLSVHLPDYMIPSSFVQIENIPLTPNGKVDRKALVSHGTKIGTGVEYAPPESEMERIVAKVWMEVLDLSEIGIDENFFEIGGNSLKAIQLNSRLTAVLEKDISIVELFDHVTIRSFVEYLQRRDYEESGIERRAGWRDACTGIAIIGMAVRFPGARNIGEFWDNLENGVESISFLSGEELEESRVDSVLLADSNYVKANGGILEDKEYFDAAFFGYTPVEAEVMHPQLRVFHECTWEALEDAGYIPGTYNGLIGVYAGASSSFHWEGLILLSGKNEQLGAYGGRQLANKDFLSTRIAYRFNLKGPAISVDTACSTSLAAVHLACRAIMAGECDIALAGGVCISSQRKQGYLYQEGMIASPDGHCRAFDARAKGTVGGNGAGVVVLKPLEEAAAAGDHIYAVIKGTAVNNDGIGKANYTAPSSKGQAEVIRMAQQAAGVDPETIGYIEAHGTGTIIGDPIEISALCQAFKTPRKGFCAVGSVKTNIGHLDAAAGVAGLIKTVLSLKHGLIPPSLNYETSNPRIDFENSPFYVNTVPREWKRNEMPRRAGVSSFGIGGTNAHVIVEEAPVISENRKERGYKLILLSAKTETALEKATMNLGEFFRENPGIDLANAAYTLQTGRSAFQHRRMIVCSTSEQAGAALTSDGSGTLHSLYTDVDDRPVVFMFSGQGSQYVNMGLDLYRSEPVFREETQRCFEILKPLMGDDLKEILYPVSEATKAQRHKEKPKQEIEAAAGSSRINRTEIAQPLLFVFEYALAKLLMKWGIEPYAMMGHSIGEYVAACLAGVFTLEDALGLVTLRGRLMQKMPPGAMLSVPLDEEALMSLLDEELSIAAVNTSSSCVVSGTLQGIDDLAKQLKGNGCETRLLHTSHAFHSKMMDPILKEFEKSVAEIPLNKPEIPYISNVTGKWITVLQAVDPGYWVKQLRLTVQFNDGLKILLARENVLFVEIGPGKALSTFVRQHGDRKPGQFAVNLVRHPKENAADDYYLLSKIGQLWLHGLKIDWSGFYGDETRYRTPLPTYPFEGQRYWIKEDLSQTDAQALLQKPLINKKKQLADFFYIPLWKQSAAPAHQEDEIFMKAPWLVFMDACGLGAQLVKKLEKKKCEVITVGKGEQFCKASEREYLINPVRDNDYHSLISELCRLKIIPGFIVHLWSVTGDTREQADGEAFNKAQYSGFYSLVYLVQAARKQNLIDDLSEDLKITVVSNNMQEVTGGELLYPGKSTLLGALKVIPQEFPNIICRSVDIVLPGPVTRREDKLIDRLLSEFSSESQDNMIAFRNNRRWVQIFDTVKLDKSREYKSPLRKAGVYLITGGLGGIGLVLARYLAGSVGARLVLTGRSAFPAKEEWKDWLTAHDNQDGISRKIRKLQKIEETGGEVMVCCADAANREQMQGVIARAEERFGPLHGVIHAAGVTGEGSIRQAVENTSKKECDRQFHPKVHGLFTLEKVLQDKPLDFCLLMSSLASVLGGLGFASYSAANIFMDAFVKKHNQMNAHNWMSVNWDSWQLEKESNRQASTGETIEESAITPQEGVEVFRRILAWDEENQVVISTRDLQARIEQWIKLKSLRGEFHKDDASPLQSRPTMSTPYTPPRNPLEHTIAGIWQKFFGFRQVGIHDDFFELGGDSLKAMNVVSRIHKALNVEIPLAEFFSKPTIGGLSGYINNARRNEYISIEPVEEKEYYVLTSAQKRLYILQQMELKSTAYNIFQVVILERELQGERFASTFRKLIKRHESLRTSFEMINAGPVQRIHADIEFEIQYDEAGSTGDTIENFIRPFDLSRAPLLRVGLVKVEGEKHILMVDMHHIISDGVSHSILLRNFMVLYKGEELSVVRIHYKDYSEWQNNLKGAIKRQEGCWLKVFAEEIPVLNLPTDFSRPVVQSFAGNTLNFKIGEEETDALNRLAAKRGITLYILLLAVFNVFLSKISSREDIVVGTPAAGRRHADLEQVIGMFVNTLCMRNYPEGEKRFVDFLREVKDSTLTAFENQEYPFEDLVEKVVTKRDASRNPLFDAMFVLQNLESSAVEIPGLKLKPYEFKNKISQFDLTLHVVEGKGKLYFEFQYCTKLFKEESVRRFIDYFKTVISLIVTPTCPEMRLFEIGIISQEEKRKILFEFNNTGADYPKDKGIHGLFAEQAARTPDGVSVVGRKERSAEPVQLTYKELNEKSGQLAHLLRGKGVRPDTIVGIMVDRSVEMITGILGILKAGGAYMPIDPEYPEERINYMLKDSNAGILVSELSKVSEEIEVVKLSELIEEYPTHFTHPTHLTQLCYIIYTSGTTGRPKGSLVLHENVVRLLFNNRFRFDFTDSDTWVLFHAFTFDFSVWEMYGALLYGGKLVVIPRMTARDPREFLEVLTGEKVTVLNQTPAAFYNLSRLEMQRTGSTLKIRYIIFGGDALNPLQLKGWKEKYPETRLVNMFGITETTVHVTFKEIEEEDIESGVSNIGRPIPTLSAYILDRHLQVVPIGVAGEICVGGKGVCRGYLNRPGLTGEKFVQNPYIKGERLYRSGDLGRYLSCGEIEYLGRMDQQVQIRGYRVEPGEIETRLVESGMVMEAVVIPLEDKKNLCAYIVPFPSNSPGAPALPGPGSKSASLVSRLKEWLLRCLPDYMVPGFFVQLARIPLTPNGKVDRKALPDPKAGRPDIEFVAPKTDRESIIAGIWKEVLGIDRVGTHDNFFDLGGNSLDLINLGIKLKEAFKTEIPVIMMFRYSTISSLETYFNMEEIREKLPEHIRVEAIARGKGKLKDLKKKMRRG